MGLQEYHRKRRFDDTPEPKGKVDRAEDALRFVVQKHVARRLHYDFRLELDGVLKSWAVPKGPSLNPSDKRLAMMVEDHPLDYRDFEGVIPVGNYGAGTVMVWDEGTYEPADGSEEGEVSIKEQEAALTAGLAKGHIRFVLHGQKLRGAFSLVKTPRSGENAWLLFKHRDEFATDDDVATQDRSAKSGRSMEEIAAEAPGLGEVWHSNRPESARGTPASPVKERIRAAAKRGAAKRAAAVPADAPAGKMPRHVKPMLATLVEAPFDREGWFFEIKWDGFRAIAEIEKENVLLYSRNQLSFNEKFGPIVRTLEKLGHDAVLDGEVVVVDAEGKSQFELLQQYQKTGRGTLLYYVFDILYLDGKDLRKLPLSERKAILPSLIRGFSNVRLSEHVEKDGKAFFQAAFGHGLEGVIAKKADSPYREGARSQNWLKIKIRKQTEAVIGGFTAARGSREAFGALVVGVYEGDALVYIGHTGGGFDTKGLAEMRRRLEPLIIPKCPFKVKPKTNAPATWVKPELVCEIAFQNWTSDGQVRMPIFLGLREDKPARSVTREVPQPVPEALRQAETEASPRQGKKPRGKRTAKRATPGDDRGSPLPPGNYTNLQKVYFPEDGFTKGDLLAYYHEVAPFIVPCLRDRPLSLNRHPNGIYGMNFFHKDMTKQPPPSWVRVEPVPSDSRGIIHFMICDDEPTLLYAANLGCIEMNPWNSRVGSLDKPDYLVIDLDPQDVPFPQVVEAAQQVRKLFEKGDAECYCKTSGKRGLHIYIPLGARYDYDQVRRFAEIIARTVKQRLPVSTSVVRDPRLRKRQIYLDFLQNRRGQTMASAYSVRPIAGALVSTPLAWKEVNKNLDPTRFNIRTVPGRLDKVGDLWEPVHGKGIDLEKCLQACIM